MTREEVIKALIKERKTALHENKQAFDMAIKALEQEPCEDAVSRQSVLEELRTCFDTHTIYDENNGENYIIYEDAVDMMEKLPSVTPTRKKGKWILTDDDFVYCSECEDSYYPRPIDASWYYCPHCGAEMESEE